MTINIPAEKVAKFIQNNCKAHLPALQALQVIIEEKRAQAAATNQALGNFNIDVITVARACEGALSSLEIIQDVADGLTEVVEAKLT